MKNIILASGSPRRKELLTQIGLEFNVITSNVEEVITMSEPQDIVCELAKTKALAVAENLKDCKNTVVIGADTIVYSDGKILGKPQNEEDAFKMIRGLSGGTHQVYTGVAIIDGENSSCFSEKTDVSVYEMSDEEIKRYIATKEPFDKAGAYGIQGGFAAFVKKIDGDYNNVVGLPVARLYQELKNIQGCLFQ